MESLEAFKDTPTKPKEESKKMEIPPYSPIPAIESYNLDKNIRIVLDAVDRAATIVVKNEDENVFPSTNDVTISYDKVPELVQFLAWAMRERMEVVSDAEQVRESEGDSERGGV